MTVFASDTFTRADAAVLGNAEVGGPWTFTDWGISGNQARRGAGSVNATVEAAAFEDHFVSLDVDLSSYVSGNQLFGPLVRYLNDSNLILWERVLVPGVEDAVKLYVEVAGVFTQRGIFGGGPGETGLNPTDLLNLRVEVTNAVDLICYVNDVERVTYTLIGSENIALGDNAGMRSEGSATLVSFDNFLVETLAAFDPILSGSGSINDQIMAGLVIQGFTTGSITDRERARLLAKLGFSATIAGYSLYDLYREAAEEPRIR